MHTVYRVGGIGIDPWVTRGQMFGGKAKNCGGFKPPKPLAIQTLQKSTRRSSLNTLKKTRQRIIYFMFHNFSATLSILSAIFAGGPGSAGTRMSPFWILLKLRMMVVVATNGNINYCVRGGHKPARWPWPTSRITQIRRAGKKINTTRFHWYSKATF